MAADPDPWDERLVSVALFGCLALLFAPLAILYRLEQGWRNWHHVPSMYDEEISSQR